MKTTGKKSVNSQNIEREAQACAETLRRGGVIVYPTDTIWGIGCDASNEAAVARVCDIKHRDPGKEGLVTLIASADELDHYVVNVPEMARELMEVATSPLTVIMEGAFNVAPNVTGANDSLGIRIPQDAFCRRLCELFGGAIVSTSANISGTPAPAAFADIAPEILEKADYVANLRRDEQSDGKASNIILLRGDGTFKIVR